MCTCASRSPRSRSHRQRILASGRAVRQVDRDVIVRLLERIPAGRIRLELALARPPRIHVLDSVGDAVLLLEVANSLDESAGVLALPSKGWMHDDRSSTHLVRHLGGAAELAPRIAPPHPLSDQQAGCVHRHDRDLVERAERLDRGDVGADIVDAHHDLDPVVAQAGGHLEPTGRRPRVDRGGRQRDARTGGHTSTLGLPTELGAVRSQLVEVLQQHAFAKSPRADLELVELEQVHRGLGHDRTGTHLVRPVRRHTRQLGDLVVRQLPRRRTKGARSARASVRATYFPSLDGGAPSIRASDRNVLLVATARSKAPPRRIGPAWSAIAARTYERSSDEDLPASSHSRVSRPAPERNRGGHIGGLVGSDRQLEGATTDVEDAEPARRPAEPAAHGQERQTRLVRSTQHLQVDTADVVDPAMTSSALAASRTADVANARIVEQPLSSAAERAEVT